MANTTERAQRAKLNFQAGQLREHLSYWKSLTSDRNILTAVTGVHLEFVGGVNPLPRDCVPYKFEKSKMTAIQAEIDDMLRKGIVERADEDPQQVISPIFTREKKNGALRIILDLSDLNQYIVYRHFKMDTLETALAMVTKNCYLASLDWRDAYYTVPVAMSDRKFLRFRWNKILYQYTALPMGLASAPRIFTKITKVMFSELRKKGHLNTAFIDDCLLLGDTWADCQTNLEDTVQASRAAGFVLHAEKSVLCPTQKTTHLGCVIDSVGMVVTLTPERTEKLLKLVQTTLASKEITIRQFPGVIGTMVASFPAVEHGKLFYRRCDNHKTRCLKLNQGSFSAKICLTPECRIDLKWWESNILTASAPIARCSPSTTVSSDASNLGWGGVRSETKTRGAWAEGERRQHINELELLAAWFTLKSLCQDLADTHVLIRIDNTTAVQYINNQGGRKQACNQIARDIWLWCINKNIWLTAAYIPGARNVEADAQSRSLHNNMEWSLDGEVFRQITVKLGSPNIDLFASRTNTKIKNFCAWKPDPEAVCIDAFTINWHPYFVYAFPPFCLIGRVLQKIATEVVTGVIIFPYWPTQPWFSKLAQMIVEFPLLLSCRSTTQPLLTHPNKDMNSLPNSRLLAALISGDKSRITDSHKKLRTFCSLHGETPPRNNTNLTFVSGITFAVRGMRIPTVRMWN